MKPSFLNKINNNDVLIEELYRPIRNFGVWAQILSTQREGSTIDPDQLYEHLLCEPPLTGKRYFL